MSAQDSLSSNVQVTSLQQHKWDLPGSIPAKSVWDYGYLVKDQPIGSTREGLIQLVEGGIAVSFVWTPKTPEPVFPERVPFLIDAFRRNRARVARNAILLGAAFLLLGILLAVGLQQWDLLYRNIFFVFGAVGLTEGIWQRARSRHYTQEDAASDASTERFTAWLKSQRLSGYTVTLGACIVVVGLAQLFANQFLREDSIKAAGLVKSAVWDGEIWRLFTATLMHANFMHFWMNFLVLLHFSRIIEQTVYRACVPLVFILSAVVGSVFSVLLYPNTTSVGASGGLMGLLGFITIASYFDRTRYPPKYFRQMIEAIILIGAFGLFGFAFIDNAAHLGGLVGGLLLGWFFLRRNEQRIAEKERLIKFGGLAALVALGFIAALAVYHMQR